MERHHRRMAVGVCRASDDDALTGVATQTQTAFNDKQIGPVPLRGARIAPRGISRRVHTLVLTGSLDRGSVHELEAELERLCEEGVAGITLDLRELTYIDAIGVSVIAFRCGLCQRRGYDFALIRGPRIVQRAFEQAGLSELLPFMDESPTVLPARVPEEEPLPASPSPALTLAEPLHHLELEAVGSGEPG
jgi:anti-anti-sigma factor